MTRSSGATEPFGKRVRAIRGERKLTQGVVAERLACSQSHLSTIEWGERAPNLLMIMRLALALECKVSELTRFFDKTDLAKMLPDRMSRRRKRGAAARH